MREGEGGGREGSRELEREEGREGEGGGREGSREWEREGGGGRWREGGVREGGLLYSCTCLTLFSCILRAHIVVRLDGNQPVRYGLKLEVDDKYRSLLVALSRLTGIKTSNLLLVEMYGSMIRVRLTHCLYRHRPTRTCTWSL